jgi:branched-chain amino acid transport system ATP-binding protein
MDKQESQHLLEVNNIEVVYNDIIQVLRGVSLHVNPGRHRRPAGNQRRRQDHHVAGHQRPAQTGKRLYPRWVYQIRGQRHHQCPGNPGGQAWGNHGTGRAPGVQTPHGGRKYPGGVHYPQRRLPENSCRQRQDVRSLPPAGKNYPPAGRVLLRRRAADDRHCPGPDGSAEDAHAGRTLFRLAPLLVKEIFQNVETINRELGTTILVVEQNAKIALQVSDYAYIMESGKIVLEGPSKELKDNPDVKEFYMGITQGGGRKSFKEVKSYKRRKRWM